MMHLSSKESLLSDEYSSWINLFNPKVSHIAVGKNGCISQSSFIASTRYANKLNKICPFIFPKMSIFNDVSELSSDNCDKNNELLIDNKVINKEIKEISLDYNNAQSKFSYLNEDSNIIRGNIYLSYLLNF
jgi:poly-D-alanine transfer protein DltD